VKCEGDGDAASDSGGLVAGMVIHRQACPCAAVAQQGDERASDLQVEVNRVLTNVVVRDKKTGE
jgi:hypothetical protein